VLERIVTAAIIDEDDLEVDARQLRSENSRDGVVGHFDCAAFVIYRHDYRYSQKLFLHENETGLINFASTQILKLRFGRNVVSFSNVAHGARWNPGTNASRWLIRHHHCARPHQYSVLDLYVGRANGARPQKTVCANLHVA